MSNEPVRSARAQRNSERIRLPTECRNRIGTRRFSDGDYRPDYAHSFRPHLLTAKTHAGVTTFTCTEEAPPPTATPPAAPLSSELRHCTAYPENSGSHLGSTLGSGKSCPDPGRLSTFGVSGLYPCRRLTYRGACIHHGSTEPAARQLFTECSIGAGEQPRTVRRGGTTGKAYARDYVHNFAGSQ